jgi:prephenate dehydrogenase
MDESDFALRDATVAVVGLGLMGGSLALALRARSACRELLGIDCNPATCAQAIARGVVAAANADLELAGQADVIVLATPVRTIIDQLPRVGAIARAGAVVMDLGSTKRDIVRAMETLPVRVQPIGGHPMCGKETAGFGSADADLFRDAVFVLTPLARTSPQVLTLAKALVETVGARACVLDAARHDQIVAAISHLPYALAATLMLIADAHARDDDLLFALAASGFRDTSRLAASDPAMLLDILLTNRDHVVTLLRDSACQLDRFADLITDRDEAKLHEILEHAALKRRELFKS